MKNSTLSKRQFCGNGWLWNSFHDANVGYWYIPYFCFAAIFIFLSCDSEEKKLYVVVELDAIFVDNKKVANIADAAKQDSFLAEALYKALQGKRAVAGIQIQIEANQNYDVFYKIMDICRTAGYTNFYIASKINDNKYIETIFLPEGSEKSNSPNLTIMIGKEYFEILAHGGSLPKIRHNNRPVDYAYKELAKALDTLRNSFIDSLNANKIIITAENNIKISYIVQIMRVARVSGFDKRNLAMTVKPKLSKEDSIRQDNEFIARQEIIDSLVNLESDTSYLAELLIENRIIPTFKGNTGFALDYAKVLIKAKAHREREQEYKEQRDSLRKEWIKKGREKEMPTVDVKPTEHEAEKEELKKNNKQQKMRPIPFL